MNKRAFIILIIISSSFSFLHSQINIDSIDSKGYYYTNEYETNELKSPNIYETYKPKAYFLGVHGYYITSAEMIPVREDLFNELISNDTIPILDLQQVFTLASISFMRNWMYTNVSCSYTLGGDEKEKDSLISRLTQYSIATKFGYNLIRKQSIVVSPYLGFRYSRFRHLTSLKEKKISLDDYLTVKDLDLRISQFSSEIGISLTVVIENEWSLTFYGSYLIHLHNNPIIRTKENRITNKIRSSMDNFVIGIGFGFGSNDLY